MSKGTAKLKSKFWDRVKDYTHEHVTNPQPGDHFTEQCASVALITDRHADTVWVARPNKDRTGWGEPEIMTVEAFKDWASYKSIPGYWLECLPDQGPAQHE